MTEWDIEQARDTYNLRHWGEGYFDINDQGRLTARSRRHPAHPGVDLYRLAEEIEAQGLALPVLVRCTDVLRERVDLLCGAFQAATERLDYGGRYTAVYPIKVNQQRTVVEHILDQGGARVGLEAGSKPELMVVLAHARADDGVVICNGYKDREYVRLALIGRQLGHRVFLVVEKLSELDLILDQLKAVVDYTGASILILDGEELVGAKQNRVVNTTLLIAAASSTVIPVSCVEQGRWDYDSPDFRSELRMMPPEAWWMSSRALVVNTGVVVPHWLRRPSM